MKTNNKQPGPGRPPGRNYGEVVRVRLPDTLLAAIDRQCSREGCSRSEFFRRALSREVRRMERKG